MVKMRKSKSESNEAKISTETSEDSDQPQWSHPIEFLLSCIAMSVGLGNVWRFPMTAYENGGGAFLIPYLFILIFIGRPLYFMELGLGQFSSSGAVKLWKLLPAFKGIGWAQVIATGSIVTYYTSLMGLSVFYFIQSFQKDLPWSICNPEFADMDSCVSSTSNYTYSENKTFVTSAEFYFYNYVLKQPDSINDGLGMIDWRLFLCLFVSWFVIFLTLSWGVKSSGKVAYFTALFPYVVLITLLIRGVTLPGAGDGILFFITPQWEKLLEPNVWYNAVTQSFFSLSVAYGSIPMFASHNKFSHSIYRDATIISFVDTGTSLLAGLTIFSVIGNLKYETQAKDIESVVTGGPGLAFVSYPTAIAKFGWCPQLFAVLFFLMLFTLGLGSASALTSMIIKVLNEALPNIHKLVMTYIVCIMGFLIGLLYVTPSGMIILDLVDFFGGQFVIYIIALLEVIGIMYLYGVYYFCRDMKFMLNVSLGIYWKLCWGFIIPVGLSGILIYILTDFNLPTYTTGLTDKVIHDYPTTAYACGWILFGSTITLIIIGFIHALYIDPGKTLWQKIQNIFQTKKNWGPVNKNDRKEWEDYKLCNPIVPIKKRITNMKRIKCCAKDEFLIDVKC